MTSGGLHSFAAPVVPFGLYAEVYDLLYQDKNYPAESEFIASLIRRFAAAPNATRIIDLACGTGRHAIELARMGFRIAGSDISEQMVTVARAAIDAERLDIPLFVESFQSCARIKGEFDIVLAMFSSLGYLQSREDLEVALSGVRSLLAPRGLFIFDVWNGLATLKDYLPIRVKRASGAATSVLRVSRTALDAVRQIATVDFEFVVMPRDRPSVEFAEKHLVRFYFPRELNDILESSGFEVLLQCPFMNSSRALEPGDWNMTFVARKT
jgi:predicted TPR repeat methyltransferase